MKKTVAVIGAGGKMGTRLSDNLKKNCQFETLYCENNPAAIERMKENGFKVTPAKEAVSNADFVVMAVPDRAIDPVSRNIVPEIRKNAMVLLLDPAAAVAGEIFMRDDLYYSVCHPCHPPLFGEQPTDEARRDFFGGVSAWQDIVIALMQGPENVYPETESLCRVLFGPVRTAHQITVEQMAILEPAMAEVVAASAAKLMKEALEETVKRGVPRAAAESFMLGHIQIPLAIVFGSIPSPFSDAAKTAIEWGTKRIINPDWRKVFEPDQIKAAIGKMLHPEEN